MRFTVIVSSFLLLFLFIGCKPDRCDPPPPNPEAGANYEDSLTKGLWAKYNFNNNSFLDQSGNNRNMVGVNNIQFGYDAWGNDNNALVFNGINNYAVIDAGKYFPEGNFTISFLMQTPNSYGRIFQKANFNDARGAAISVGFDEAQYTQRLVFNISKDNNVCNVYTDATNSTPLYMNKVFRPDAWYFIVVQHVNGVEKVYINGSLVASQTTPNQTFKNCTSAPFYLGMWWLQDVHAYKGKIDELRIYTRALNVNEINYLYGKLK